MPLELENLRASDILNDDSSSNWLKNAVRTAEDRDIIDALNDAEVLQRVLQNEFKDRVIKMNAIIKDAEEGIKNGQN